MVTKCKSIFIIFLTQSSLKDCLRAFCLYMDVLPKFSGKFQKITWIKEDIAHNEKWPGVTASGLREHRITLNKAISTQEIWEGGKTEGPIPENYLEDLIN